MLILRGPDLVHRIAHTQIRALVEQRFAEICAGEPYDYDHHGYMILVEPGDTGDALQAEIGAPVLNDPYDGTRFGGRDFAPSCEAIDEHPWAFELVWVLTDSFGVDVFVPKADGIDAELLAFCAAFATPTNYPLEPDVPL
jgi:hypothetical protein